MAKSLRVKGTMSTTLLSNGIEENLQMVACVLPSSEFLLVRHEKTSHLRGDPNDRTRNDSTQVKPSGQFIGVTLRRMTKRVGSPPNLIVC